METSRDLTYLSLISSWITSLQQPPETTFYCCINVSIRKMELLCFIQIYWLILWHLEKKKIRYMHTLQHQLNTGTDKSIPSMMWRVHPWRLTRDGYRNMTKWLCSCHSAANVNVWRANVVSSREMNSGVRGGRQTSFGYMNKHNFWVVIWCDGVNMTSTCNVNGYWGGYNKGNENDWLWGEKNVFSPDILPFQNDFKEGVISLFNISISDSTISQTAKGRNARHTWHTDCYTLTELLKQPCVLNPDKGWLLMTFLKTGIRTS